MYHCRFKIYTIGHDRALFQVIREMAPPERFTHDFVESGEPEAALAAQADLILADLRGMDPAAALRTICSGKRDNAELVLLAEKEQLPLPEDALEQVSDIWSLPLSEQELRFRFSRLQRLCKERLDAWEIRQYLEAAMDSVPNLVWYKDKNGIHERVNKSFCQTVNKTREQVQGRGHAYIWDVEKDDPACIESERVVMEERRTLVSEEMIQTGNGLRLLTTYKSPLYDLDGSVMGTVGIGIDVTQERAYEQEIRRKSHTLETIFTAMDCGVLCHSLDGVRLLSVNRAALEILGYHSQEELMADGFLTVANSVVDEDKPRLRTCIESLSSEGDSTNVEYRVRHTDGSIVHVMGNVKLIRENGELICQRFLLDCTAQKLREESREKELFEKERRHKELLRALSADYRLVCYFDLATGRGDSLRVDDTRFQVLGDLFSGELQFDECMKEYIEQRIWPEDREQMREVLTAQWLEAELDKKETCYANYRIIGENGQMEYMEMKAVQAGSSRGIVLGLRSVDEETRKEMEKKALLEDALTEANRASKAKTVFLSNMSHDIRTPMNAIVGFTSLAISHIDQRDLVEGYLKKIMSSGNHLLSLINDVLEMSRIESGKMRLEEAPCSLPDILHGLLNIVQADIHAKQLEFHIDAADVVHEEVYCDRLRLNQLLLNLLSNSVKYTPAGGAVSMRIVEKPGAPAGCGNYEFHIKDTGIGMSREFIEHIFEPFERERNSTISRIQGTGLGMAISKNIVDMMNGTITVKSEQGKGTEFGVSLTFRLSEAEKEPRKPAGAKAKTSRHACRILLAEDNELNQEIAQAILEEAGFILDIAENGAAAVELLCHSEPGYYQIVLMDIQMPVMDGYTAAKTIRALPDPELSSIPILAMTANAFEEDKQAALKCGMNGHIAKPIQIGTLMEALDEVLG